MPSAETPCLYEREDHLRAIGELLRNGGGALVVTGEPGSGRTSVLREATRLAVGHLVLASAATPDEAGLPGAALHRLLRPVRDRLAGLPPHHAACLTSFTEGLRGHGDQPLAVPAALLELLCRLAADAPVLCTIDDADHLDAESRTALTFAARRLAACHVTMLFATWDAPPAGLPSLRLGPLTRNAAAAVLAGLMPAPEVAGALVEMAAGNPLALQELAATLSAAQRGGHAPLPTAPPPGGRLRRTYRALLDRLPPDGRAALLLAAADDDLTPDELIRATGLPGGTSLAGLASAERAGLLSTCGDHVEVRPALLRAVAYEEATTAERHAAHRALAAALDPSTAALRRAGHRAATAAGPDEALSADLARLAQSPGERPALACRALEHAARLSPDPSRAAAHLVAAARLAVRSGDPGRARHLVHRAARASQIVRAEAEALDAELDLRTGQSPAPHRIVAAATTLARRDRPAALEALVTAGDALLLTGDYAGLPALARRAADLRRTGDPPRAELLAEFLAGSTAIYAADFARAAPPLRRVREIALELDEPDALTRAAAAAVLLGDDSAAHALASRAAALARTRGDLGTLPVALEYAAGALFALGRHDDAAETLREGWEAARASGQSGSAGGHLATLGVLAAMHGDADTARLRVREAARSGRGRILSNRVVGDWAIAEADLLAGRPAEAFRRLAPVMVAADGHGHRVVRMAATPCAVEAAARCGDARRAAGLTAEFDRWAPHTGNPDWLALSARCHALAAGDGPAAAEHFARALGEHERGESAFERARTQFLFGEHLRRRRRPLLAREQLRSALDTFARLDRGWWAARVAAELRAAGETPDRPAAPAGTLTAQQTHIARLVARGATNREVAATLYLSPRTVDHHLRNIFTRLGIRSRVDLARLFG